MPKPSEDIANRQPFGASSLHLCALIVLGFCVGFVPALGASALQVDLSELPILFPVQSPDVAVYFGEIARKDDIAAGSPEYLGFVTAIPNGEGMVVFRSWADAEQELGPLSDHVDWVMYNPENWELTPGDEKQDLGSVVQRAAELTHAHDLRFMFAPDRRFAESYLAQVGPYVDAVLLQGQRLQHDPEAFSTWVLKMVDVAREANPDMLVYVQVGATRGPAAEMYTAIQTVGDEIDGISIWSMPRSLRVLQEFVDLLRADPSAIQVTPSPTLTATWPTPTPTSMPGQTLKPSPTVASRTGTATATSPPSSPTVISTPATTAFLPGDGTAQKTRLVTTLSTDPPTTSLAERNERTRALLADIGLAVSGIVVGLLAGYWLFRTRKGSPS